MHAQTDFCALVSRTRDVSVLLCQCSSSSLLSTLPPAGTLRPVRRSFYEPTSAPAQGWVWEWENDAGSWTPYDTEVGITIQAARDRQQPWLDLAPLGFCYLIDFQTMTQINRQTQRRRRIQRRSDLAYPLVSGPLPKAWGSSTGGAGGVSGALLGVAVSGVGSSGNGSVSNVGATLPPSSLGPLGRAVPTVPVKNLNSSSPVHPALAGITGILMSAAGLPVCLTRPPKLVLHPPPVSKSDIKPIPGLGHCCRKTTKKQVRKGKTPEEVVKKYLQKVRNPPEEDCTICMEPLGGPSGYKGPGVAGVARAESVGRLSRCGHQYHVQCLVAMYNNGNRDGSLQCPTCKTIYGVKTGSQPPGKMEYHVIPHSLPGHPDCRTIRIIYTIPPGIQVPPNTFVRRTSGVQAAPELRVTPRHRFSTRVLNTPIPGSPSRREDSLATATCRTARRAARAGVKPQLGTKVNVRQLRDVEGQGEDGRYESTGRCELEGLREMDREAVEGKKRESGVGFERLSTFPDDDEDISQASLAPGAAEGQRFTCFHHRSTFIQ
ncbi:E3 ubiquitin-protein ligase DTX4-like [Scleropages formosus]|uniref:E3 ubiquitin-protein ligase n=1 Tax=Scleropages formosus TaxID=113540 RepID=A0A0P7U414_SCLFO|nr:E3 ubiquitin-protein ligase DTX4-like [Scleropages formosus]